MNDCWHPSAALLCKLGSLVYHLEEFLDTGEPLDKEAAKSVREDPEVEQWFSDMGALGLLPVKRPTHSGGSVDE